MNNCPFCGEVVGQPELHSCQNSNPGPYQQIGGYISVNPNPLSTCKSCNGLIMEPGRAYGYSGPVCYCGWKTISAPQQNSLEERIEKLEKSLGKSETDVSTARQFFDMLRSKGVKIEETHDNGPGFKIISYLGTETLEFCFFQDGHYWRIMGYDESGAYSDEIHKDGWKSK